MTVEIKDLATSRQEFFRNLENALRGLEYQIDGDCITVSDGPARVEISLSPLPPRRLSPLLSLERWQATLAFTGHTAQTREGFLKKFDRAFQRGGG